MSKKWNNLLCPTPPQFSQGSLKIQKHHGLYLCEIDWNVGRIGFLEVIFHRGWMNSELWMSWRLSPLSPRLLNVLETVSTFSTSLLNCGGPKLGTRNYFRCISPLPRRWNIVSLTSHAPPNVTCNTNCSVLGVHASHLCGPSPLTFAKVFKMQSSKFLHSEE